MEHKPQSEPGQDKGKDTNEPESARRLVMLQSLPPREPNETAEAWADRVMEALKRRGEKPGDV
jgi:hypothetical protein